MARFPASVLLPLLAAALWAQPQASPSRSAPKAKSSLPDSGVISQGVYRNRLSVSATSFRSAGSIARPTCRTTPLMPSSRGYCWPSSNGLRKRAGDTINSAVVIAVEPLPSGMSTAADYFESLAGLTTAKGFQAANEAQELSVGHTKLLRGDFTKPRGTLTMRQTSLVLVQRSQAISFTFIGGSEDEVNELIERLSFASRKPTR